MTEQPTPATPREHCGVLSPEIGMSAIRTECVLRPGHQGSHADDVGCRWWPAPVPYRARAPMTAAQLARMSVEAHIAQNFPVPDNSRTTADNPSPGDSRICCTAAIGHRPNCAANQAAAEQERLRELYAEAIEAVQHGQAAPVEVGDERIVDAVLDTRDTAMADLRKRHAQAEELLAVAHETSNRSEAARAREAKRAEQLRGELLFEREQRDDLRRRLGETSDAYGRIDDQLATARTALDRVRSLHVRVVSGRVDVCTRCSDGDYPNYEVAWPCPTIAALDQPDQEQPR